MFCFGFLLDMIAQKDLDGNGLLGEKARGKVRIYGRQITGHSD